MNARSKVLRLALVGALAVLVLPYARASARSAPKIVVRDGVTQPVFSYAQAIRETVYVQSTMDGDLDGRLDLLATDIIRPKETQKGLKVPVIYEMSPYYQQLGRGNESETKTEEDGDFSQPKFPLFYDNYFVPRGYAVVLQDMRGTRNSEGCQVYGEQAEPLDAQATINWLNGKGTAFTASGEEVKASWSTGKVGMIGKSYDGSVANGAASLGVKGLETIVPISAISSWYDYHYHNGAQYTGTLLTPTAFAVDCPVLCTETTPPLSSDEERGPDYYRARVAEHGFCSAHAAALAAQAANPLGTYTPFWAARDYHKDVKNVRASVFVIHGLNDYNVKPSNYVGWWLSLSKRDVPRKIWLAQPGHVDPFDFRRAEWVDTLHRWFDFWLQGIDNGIMDEPMADVETSAGHWETYSTWPIPGSTPTKLHFGPEAKGVAGTLSLKPAKEGSQSYTSPIGTGNDEQLVASPEIPRADRLVFVTPRLKRDVRLSGPISVDITASLDRPDTNFSAFLVDYGEGKSIRKVLYTQGDGVTDTQKETCWGASTKEDDACYKEVAYAMGAADFEIVSRGYLDAKHHESLELPTPIIPTQPYRFVWDLYGDDYTFEAGHRLGVVIAGNSSLLVPDPSGATVTVDLTQSRITLPIVGGGRAFAF
ncbi:MAG TPA: CocE/NonD family hydrolase [Actinomycetota bacterium]|nr:CocE/NonD family hydrolase [Actinomycetota bacterium]